MVPPNSIKPLQLPPRIFWRSQIGQIELARAQISKIILEKNNGQANSFFVPIESMGLVYLLTWMVDFDG